jgi:hypothetical protein
MKISTRVKAAALILLSVALFNGMKGLKDRVDTYSEVHGIEQVALYVDRFTPVKPMLPPGEVVGYISDEPQTDDFVRRFFLTRFALSPVELDAKAQHRVVLGDFIDPRNTPKAAAQLGLTVEKDFGKGVVLLRRNP